MLYPPVARIDPNGIQNLLNNSNSVEPLAVAIQVIVMIALSVSYTRAFCQSKAQGLQDCNDLYV